jgi:hypothetical protein
MRNRKRTAYIMEIPENITQEEFKKLVDQWWTRGGYEQMIINGENITTNYASYRDDLPAFVIEQWFKLDWEKQLKICKESGSPERWCTRVGSLSIKSNSSPFHSQYRKFSLKMREQFDSTTNLTPMWGDNEEEDFSENICVKCLKLEIEKLDWYEKLLVDHLIYQQEKPRHVAAKYELEVASVQNHWTAIKKKLKKSCENYH